ncbi:MAG: hypothetical protein AABW73_02165 [Nanoarchaeota archaeon]
MKTNEKNDAREVLGGLAKIIEKRMEEWKPDGKGSLVCEKRILAGFSLMGVDYYNCGPGCNDRFIKIGVEYKSRDGNQVDVAKFCEAQEMYDDVPSVLVILGGFNGPSNTNYMAYQEFVMRRWCTPRRELEVTLQRDDRHKAFFGGIFSKYQDGNPRSAKVFLEDVASFIRDPQSVPVVMKRKLQNRP